MDDPRDRSRTHPGTRQARREPLEADGQRLKGWAKSGSFSGKHHYAFFAEQARDKHGVTVCLAMVSGEKAARVDAPKAPPASPKQISSGG